MKRVFPLLGLLLLGVSAMAASGSASSDNTSIQQPFVVAFPKTNVHFDPIYGITSTEAQIYTALYEGLVTYNPVTLEPLPGVAKSWDITDHGTVYTFHLRNNAEYWNGQPVTAQDFRNSWLHVLDPKVKAQYSFLLDSIVGAKAYRTGKSTDPNSVGIKVINNETLQVTLAHPAAEFLKILCHYSFVPIPPGYIDKKNWAAGNGVIPGNGPFYVIKHTATEIDLTKNNLYWDAANVLLPSIKIMLTDNAATVTKDFNNGAIQWATGNVEWNKVNKTNAIIVNPLFATSYFYFKADKAPWNNPEVRRALALLLPWSEIRQKSDLYIPASTLVPRISSYPEVTGIDKSNPTEALDLLKKAGFPNGSGLPTITILIPNDPESARIAGIMLTTWEKDLRANVKVETMSYSDYYTKLDSASYTLATMTWIGDFADPLTFLQMWTTTSNLNSGGYSDTKYDDLITQSMGETGDQRYKTLGDAETVLLDGAEVLPIDHTPALNLIDLNEIEGWFPNPLDIHPFKYIAYRTPAPIPGVALAPGYRRAPVVPAHGAPVERASYEMPRSASSGAVLP